MFIHGYGIGHLDFGFLIECLTIWISLYGLLGTLLPSKSAEWHCRTVTVVHAIVISGMAGWCCFVEGPWPLTDAGGPNTPSQIMTATICLAYFMFDFTWCLYYQTEGFTMLLHHFLSIIGLSVSLLVGKYGTELVATICGGEITNPLLQLRWFLRETGHKDSTAAFLVDLSFVCSFGFMRLGVGTILLYCYFTQPTDYLGRFGALCIYSLGIIFWVNIMQFAMRKFSGKSNLKRKIDHKLKANGTSSVQDTNTKSVANGYYHKDRTSIVNHRIANGVMRN